MSLLDVEVAVDVTDAALARAVASLWEPFLAEATGRELVVGLRETQGGWQIDAGSGDVRSASTRWEAVLLLRGVLDDAATSASGLCRLHAAVVVKGTSALAIPGAPGSGKTTLALGLHEKGWSLACDDLAPLALGGEVLGFPRPIGLRRDAVGGRDLPRASEFFELLGEPVGPFLIPATAYRFHRGSVKITNVVFPTFEPDAALDTEELAPAETLARAARSLQPLDASSMGVARDALGHAAGLRLTFGSGVDVAALVDNWVGAVEIGAEVADNEVSG